MFIRINNIMYRVILYTELYIIFTNHPIVVVFVIIHCSLRIVYLKYLICSLRRSTLSHWCSFLITTSWLNFSYRNNASSKHVTTFSDLWPCQPKINSTNKTVNRLFLSFSAKSTKKIVAINMSVFFIFYSSLCLCILICPESW